MAFSTHDQVPDSPTNVYATMSQLWPEYTSSYPQSDGNLKVVTPVTGNFEHLSTIPIPKTGKYYFEILLQAGSHLLSGIFDSNRQNGLQVRGTTATGVPATTWLYVNGSGSANNASDTLSVTAGQIVSMLIDLENNQTKVYVNNSLTDTDNISTLPDDVDYFVSLRDHSGSHSTTQIINFGQDSSFGGNKTSGSANAQDANGYGSFYYSPPTGALALCTANLPDPDIDPALDDLPEDYFKAVKYTGQTNETGVSTWDSNTSTGTVICGFPVDLAWIKVRNAVGGHRWYDTVRGANQILISNETSEERTFANEVIGFNSTGFNNGNASTNSSGATYIAWCWKAGGAPTADNSNTSGAMTANSVSVDGTLQSSYTPSGSPTIYPKRMSVNTKAGFSIVKYTGTGGAATVPHGLSSAPDIIITKETTSTSTSGGYWNFAFKDLGFLHLNATTSLDTGGGTNGTVGYNNITSSTFSFITGGSSNNNYNNSGSEYIVYCWHSVAGYSAFGSYTGNGSTDGPFVYTGFKPAWVMIKRTDTTGNWAIVDNARNEFNLTNKRLFADESWVESDLVNVTDFTSNGFKIRDSAGSINDGTVPGTYIYAAFAEQPFKYATAR